MSIAQRSLTHSCCPPLLTPYPPRYATVLEAERSLLYTLGFDFNIDVLHTHLARLLKRPRFKSMGLGATTQAASDFQQYAVSFANDIYVKDGTLLLEVRPRRRWRWLCTGRCCEVGGSMTRHASAAACCQPATYFRLPTPTAHTPCCPPAPVQWPLEKLAIAVYYMIFKGLKANNIRHIPTPPATSSGTPWCAGAHGVLGPAAGDKGWPLHVHWQLG